MLLQRKLSAMLALLIFGLAAIGVAGSAQAAFINLTPTTDVNSTTSVKLGDLVGNAANGIVVGDKQFSGFNYSGIGDMPLSSDVNVFGFKDPSGNWGISFH